MTDDFDMREEAVRGHLDRLASTDVHIAAALERAGYPPERRRDHGFDTLLRVIVGQQVSVQAANSIYTKLTGLIGEKPRPSDLIAHDIEALRGAGLSRQKAVYAHSLADAILSGTLPIKELHIMDDGDAVAAITSVKGLGRWSAEMYLIASLGRTDIWPVDDIAVQEGVKRMIGLEDRPKPKALDEIGERWRPYRSSVALLAWHYYGIVAL